MAQYYVNGRSASRDRRTAYFYETVISIIVLC